MLCRPHRSRHLLFAYAVFFTTSGQASAIAPAANLLTVYACEQSRLVQSQVNATEHAAAAQALLRAGHAVWSNGRVDTPTIDALAEGRGIWSAAPLTTLAQLAATDVPADVLTAIAVKESGLKNRYWPWTINWMGRGWYLDSRQKAVEAARYLLSQGIVNFDVSLMQINWRWHQHRFADIESAFDPITSVRVAGQILTENFKTTGNWSSAIARYHSRNPSLNQPYLNGVLQHLSKLQKARTDFPEKELCTNA